MDVLGMASTVSRLHAIALVLLVAAAFVVPLYTWRMWYQSRFVRRRKLLFALAPRLGLSCYAEGASPPETEADLQDVSVHIGGTREGFRVDICERLGRIRGQGVSTETQTVVEVSALQVQLPEFLITPQDSHTRYLYHVTRTPHIVIAGREAFVTHNFVMGKDEDAIRRVLTRPVQELLHDNTVLCVECSGRTLRFYHFDVLLDEPEIVSLLSSAVSLAQALRTAAQAL